MLSTLVLELTHTGQDNSGKPVSNSLLIPDLDTGLEYQFRKSKVYVPHLGTITIPISNRVIFSMYYGAIKKYVSTGMMTARTLVDVDGVTSVFPASGGGGGRIEYVANVVGKYLPGVACLVSPNGGSAITIDPTKCLGSAQSPSAALTVDFRVEKTSASTPAAIGSGLKLFDMRFNSVTRGGAAVNTVTANLSVATGELLRIITPTSADSSLSDVAISLIGST
jgi:hypothetical protein